MEPRWAQGVNNGHPITIHGQRAHVWILVQVHEKCETCFIQGVGKTTEFSVHHFSNRDHFDLYMVLVDDL